MNKVIKCIETLSEFLLRTGIKKLAVYNGGDAGNYACDYYTGYFVAHVDTQLIQHNEIVVVTYSEHPTLSEPIYICNAKPCLFTL